MKAILNNKLYDTEKAEFILGISVPQNNFGGDVDKFNIYKTKKGNVFAEHMDEERLLSDNTLKNILSRPDCVDIYIKVFGEVEEA